MSLQIFTSLIRLADRHRLVLSFIAIISDLNCQFYSLLLKLLLCALRAAGERQIRYSQQQRLGWMD